MSGAALARPAPPSHAPVVRVDVSSPLARGAPKFFIVPQLGEEGLELAPRLALLQHALGQRDLRIHKVARRRAVWLLERAVGVGDAHAKVILHHALVPGHRGVDRR